LLHADNRSFRRLVIIGAIVAASGCRRAYPLGSISVRVVGEQNDPVSGVPVDLYRIEPKGRVYWRAVRTGSTGSAKFGEKNGGVIEGDYVIRITPMPWQRLATGQASEHTVNLKKGDDVVVEYRVVPRRPPAGPMPRVP
jgi:hypothetical protein